MYIILSLYVTYVYWYVYKFYFNTRRKILKLDRVSPRVGSSLENICKLEKRNTCKSFSISSDILSLFCFKTVYHTYPNLFIFVSELTVWKFRYIYHFFGVEALSNGLGVDEKIGNENDSNSSHIAVYWFQTSAFN